MAKLKIDRGTTYKRSGKVRDNSKQPISLVGSTIRFTVKTSEFDSDADDNSAVIQNFPSKVSAMTTAIGCP